MKLVNTPNLSFGDAGLGGSSPSLDNISGLTNKIFNMLYSEFI